MAILTLPIEVVHLIAAGEVIDSLAAVVRELAENAIDAGADRIVISLWLDSLSVQVSDNGAGMAIADLSEAATPHSTSKIRKAEDLRQIKSLGFRGEALYSLAQLADLTICSRPRLEPVGYQVQYDQHGQWRSPPKAVAIACGTVVTVQNLFANYPNRQQSLPSRAQQIRKVQLQIQHMAIAHPQINWQVRLDHREWISLWAGATSQEILPQIITSIQPYDLVHRQFALEDQAVAITLGLPDRLSRPRPDWLKIILNGRVITSPELEQTVLSSLERTLPRRRFPVCLVHLELPCDRIDWNRHPTKSEVYIQDLDRLQQQLRECIAQTLKTPVTTVSYTQVTQELLRSAERKTSYLIPAKQENFQQNHPTLKAIAQVLNTYILAEHAGGLWLIEQHVAHERILFERIEQQWQIVAIAQPILLSQISDDGITQLQMLGIEIEAFGNDLWAVRSLPEILIGQPECATILREMSQQLDPTMARATVACRCAIRNGQKLDLATMRDLLQQWQQTDHPHTCPHGRPICLAIDESDLARFFRRNWLIDR
ncbi:MAG: DNA mismatch repair endonuclease MutL [Pseudanabaenaceae cyanobacterium bins.39]|nr:DNA mismatch repair endonuclease MutL [Pseudanabaenaceae cyanobacterium bins.39]